MFRGPLRSRRLRNDRRHRFARWCRIDRQGPLHIPYRRTQLSPLCAFASLRETGPPRPCLSHLRLCVRHGKSNPGTPTADC